MSTVLGSEDAGWYHGLFANEAMRAVEAQRRLTSYTDPFTGWVLVDGKAFVVRQRSPYKEGFDLGTLSAEYGADANPFSHSVALMCFRMATDRLIIFRFLHHEGRLLSSTPTTAR